MGWWPGRSPRRRRTRTSRPLRGRRRRRRSASSPHTTRRQGRVPWRSAPRRARRDGGPGRGGPARQVPATSMLVPAAGPPRRTPPAAPRGRARPEWPPGGWCRPPGRARPPGRRLAATRPPAAPPRPARSDPDVAPGRSSSGCIGGTLAILLQSVGECLPIPGRAALPLLLRDPLRQPIALEMTVMVLDALGHALSLAAAMAWEILWALILGFAISGVVQAVVSKAEMGRLLPDDSPRSLGIACGLGAASSSCSYAAVAMARSVFRKGADFTSAMAFQFASTNLVVELGIILAVLLGWQFTAAEFVGGPLMIVLLALLFRALLRPQMVREAREQADRGLVGVMEGHAAMDMSVTGGSLWSRIRSPKGFAAISHSFVMDWVSVWKDIAAGLLVAGALGAWLLARLWGPLVGPLVAMLSFVCSIGNVPLAAVLWNGGISFGGVIAFIFADLIVLPILNIYRRYYGARMSLFLLGTFYLTMAAAGLLVDLLFEGLGLVPEVRNAKVVEASITRNYTSVLNLLFLALAAVLVVRFLRTNGPEMLRMMSAPPGRGSGDSQEAAG